MLAVARGQYVRPVAGIPSPAAAHYRLRSPDGRLAAIATADGTRLAPDKVFVSPASGDAAKAVAVVAAVAAVVAPEAAATPAPADPSD